MDGRGNPGYATLVDVAGMILGARLRQMVAPKTMGGVTASVTISLAAWLILFNSAKLLGAHP